MIWFIHTTAPSPVTYLPQRSVFIFIMRLQPYRIQPTHNLKVQWCWGGESPRTAYLTCYQKLPETCSLSFPQTPTSPTLLPLKERAAAEETFPPRSHCMMWSWPLLTGREGLMKQNEVWRVKSKKIHIVPKSEDAKHSLTEQEAKARQQSLMPVKTIFMRSATYLSWSEINKLHCSWRSPKSHLCLPGQNWVNQRKRKIAFFFRADISICRTTCP